MTVAIQSMLDLSAMRTLAARRLVGGPSVLRPKLDILRRVLRRDLDGTLPSLVETRAEQSWNEQVFARVLDYQTLFSHDSVPYHLQPKVHAGGRYNDFSLGFFGLDGDLVLASAELKSPGASLDDPQPSYGGKTAVQQAHEVAGKIATCRWALASNLVELRLYAAGVFAPLATAHLRDVRSSRELAAVLAHFDKGALLGARSGGDVAMVKAMTDDHPGAVLPPEAGSYRVIARFVPVPERERALYEIERTLRTAATSAPGWFRFFDGLDYGRSIRPRARLKDGWVAVDAASSTNKIALRVAASTTGEVVVSARVAAGSIEHLNVKRPGVDIGWIIDLLRYFAGVAEAFEPQARLEETRAHDLVEDPADYSRIVSRGLISAELRDVDGAFLIVRDPIHDNSAPNAGLCETSAALTGDFTWTHQSATTIVAACACEIAVHFRDAYGGVGLVPEAVKAHMDRLDAHDRGVAGA